MTGLVPVIHAATLRKSFKRVTRRNLVDGRIKSSRGHVPVIHAVPARTTSQNAA
jgi:hypothetical protein